MWNSLEGRFLIGSLLIVVLSLQLCDGQLLEGIYCGRENCYDVLNVTRSTSLPEIRRAYRSLAKGESELVSGFNIEYSRGGFALIF